MHRATAVALLALAMGLGAAAAASAGPVATSDAEYMAYGRVFPDPQGGACAAIAGGLPAGCSPLAQGTVPAATHIGLSEFAGALRYMNQRRDWQRYMEVWPLDSGKFPGNDLGNLEFSPDADYVSAGLPTSTLGRARNKLYVIRVTDESVPDAGKKRYALSLSIHGIERAGVEGGVRAMEDLVTSFTSGRFDKPILRQTNLPVAVPTFGDVLKKTIVYFAFINPDGWARGSIADLGASFQRYNGNGVDLNRDWPDIGYAFRPYSTFSEPESRAFANFFLQVQDRGGRFAAGDDLHGQLNADSFSYTLMPHGSHDFAKNTRIREAVKTINLVQADVLKWSPLIKANDAATDDPRLYGQTWGTVYDTINYTVTGAVGDFFDSSIGLNADGIDNEMSFSHLAPNTVFDAQIEQLHVDGNAGLIYAHLAEILGQRDARWTARGRKGYVPLGRVAASARPLRATPPGTKPQAPIELTATGTPDSVVQEFDVIQDAKTFNGGMRVELTQPNVQGITPAALSHKLAVQCSGCDEHPGVKASQEEDWITVAEDFNQSGAYLQAGLVATVNYPEAFTRGHRVRWRVQVTNPVSPVLAGKITFTAGPASRAGDTGGAFAPEQSSYNVAATDFWTRLNAFAPAGNQYEEVDPAKRLPPLDTLVVTDEAPAGDAFVARARAFVEGGGNLVLTDGALRLLPRLFARIGEDKVAMEKVYVGQVAFTTQDTTSQSPDVDGSTTKDPLAQGVVQQGARFNSGLRRQTFEPVPIGYSIQHPTTGADQANTPEWTVDAAAFKAAGGRIVGSGVAPGDNGAGAVVARVSLGELPLGKGVVRVIGALLPQPTERFDHNEGLEPHAVTYTGYELARNLTDYCRPDNASCGAPFGASIPAGDRLAPVSRFLRRASLALHRRGLVLRGTARDRAPRGLLARVGRVDVAIALRQGSRCRYVSRNGRLGRAAACSRRRWVPAKVSGRVNASKRAWRLALSRTLPRGSYVATVRATDAVGNRERPGRRNAIRFRL